MRVLLGAILVILCVVVDRVTKDLVQQTLAQTEPRSLLGGMLVLTYAENEGAFLGLGANLPSPVRFALSFLANGAMIAWGLATIVRADDTGIVRLIGVALLLGGGIGNLIDRLQRGGAVTDFMVLRLGPVQTGVFNVADFAITGGALAIAALALCEGVHLAQQGAGQGTESDSESIVTSGKKKA